MTKQKQEQVQQIQSTVYTKSLTFAAGNQNNN